MERKLKPKIVVRLGSTDAPASIRSPFAKARRTDSPIGIRSVGVCGSGGGPGRRCALFDEHRASPRVCPESAVASVKITDDVAVVALVEVTAECPLAEF